MSKYYPWNVHLQWHSDPVDYSLSSEEPAGTAPGEAGQGEGSLEGQDDTAPEGQAAESPDTTGFFSHTFPDGTKKIFKDQAELSSYLHEGTLRRNRFTQLTQEAAEKRKAIEARQKALDERESQLKTTAQLVHRAEQFFQTPRGQAVKAQLEQQFNGAPQTAEIQTALQQELNPLVERLEALEAENKALKSKNERNSAYTVLETRYPDFDRQAVENYINEVLVPAEDEAVALFETVYFGLRGKNGHRPEPKEEVEVETPKPPMKRIGRPASKPEEVEYENLDDAANAALKDLKAGKLFK
jgi:uncharacterized protein (UPF0335 family)